MTGWLTGWCSIDLTTTKRWRRDPRPVAPGLHQIGIVSVSLVNWRVMRGLRIIVEVTDSDDPMFGRQIDSVYEIAHLDKEACEMLVKSEMWTDLTLSVITKDCSSHYDERGTFRIKDACEYRDAEIDALRTLIDAEAIELAASLETVSGTPRNYLRVEELQQLHTHPTRNPKRSEPPTDDEYAAFSSSNSWTNTPDHWICPVCQRTKRQLMIWGYRKGTRARYVEPVGWKASLTVHHDHGRIYPDDGRFSPTLICGACNSLDAQLKSRIGIAGADFSFSVAELRMCLDVSMVIANRPLPKTAIHFELAQQIYNSLRAP